MLTKDFYRLVDNELDSLLGKYKEDQFIKKHRSAINNQKSYALLIWFLDFYGRISNYSDFITDGDNDSSCDIIFDNLNNHGERIFYVVQSKWNNESNSEKETDKNEILKALSDFETILRGEKQNVNPKLSKKLEELDVHLKANGEVKFIFLSLSQYHGGADDNIATFINNDDKIKFEVIDINRIRVDYIDRKYKKIEPVNPLENYQNPEESPVTIEFAQKFSNFIKIEKPFEAYMVLLRPKTVFDLFDKYGFALFYKNVRNPLLQSQFNEDIGKTAIENPAYFWYYNNGITAITYLLPAIGKQAMTVNLTGLQVINGAQTVYSIYRAYKSASPAKRAQMDAEALVTLRLLKSGGKDFDMNVTRFTNSQNPVNDRDFCANDDIQVRLQNESYRTRVWYEKRQDEFRETPDGVKKVPNNILANVYLAYHLQDPGSVFKNHQSGNSKKNLNFISHKDHKDGLYEKIFNRDTSFADILCSFYVYDSVMATTPFSYQETFRTNLYYLLGLFKTAFDKYLQAKYGDPGINVNREIVKQYEGGNREIFIRIFKFLNDFVRKQVESTNGEVSNTVPLKFLFNTPWYEKIKDQLYETDLKPDDIDNIVLSDGDDIIGGETAGQPPHFK